MWYILVVWAVELEVDVLKTHTLAYREILVVQFSRRAVENSKVSRVQAVTFQEGRDRMHTTGERQVQIPKSLEEKSKSGSVYNRRFQGGDCRFQPSLNSPEADPNGPTCRFLEN